MKPAPPQPRNNLALTSFIMSVGALCFLPFIGHAIALATGYTARAAKRRRPYPLKYDNLVHDGLVLSWLGLALWLTVVAVVIFVVIPYLQDLGRVLLNALLLKSN